MKIGPLQEGRLLRRYKRFLADVELPDGEVITVHCPNTGAMTGCAEAGSRVWLSHSDSKTRKYPHTWELVETAAGMACIHSAKANPVVREALEAGRVPELAGFTDIRSEVKYGAGSRADLVLARGEEQVYIEVKCVTLGTAGGQGLLPDAVSDRGRKHLRELQAIRDESTRAVMFYCVFHAGVEGVSAAGEIDPRYRDALAQAMDAGVEVLAWRADVSPTSLKLVAPLPFSLDPEP